jgi:hypothetical protein
MQGEYAYDQKEVNMKKTVILLVVILTMPVVVYSQLQINWQQCYGSMAPDYAYDIAETDGGYLVTGIAGTGGGEVDCFERIGGGWLIKIDDSGSLIWQKCFDHAHALRIIKTIGSPYYYLIGGTISEPYPNTYNLWVAKIDTLGNIIWERILGNNIGILGGDQYGEATADGGVIATAQIDSKGGDITHWHGGYDGWVIKLDSLGNTQWDQSIGSSQFEFINGIIQTSDGGYLAGLYGTPSGIGGNVDCVVFSDPDSPDAIVFKMDSLGNHEWHKCYGGTRHDGIVRLLETEGGYLLAGFGSSTDGDLEGCGWHEGWHNSRMPTLDVWLMKIDFAGNIIWQKCYGGSGSDSPVRIFQTSDGGFIVFSNTTSFDGDVVGNPSAGPTNPSIWIFKVDNIGNLLWQQCIGGASSERVHGVAKLSDSKYVVAGEMYFSPSGDVNCSNFVSGSRQNYWVFGISDTTVNVQEIPLTELNFRIYPNPANSFIYIESNELKNKHKIGMLNLLGETILEKEINFTRTYVDITSLPQGVYILKIMNSMNSVVSIQKIIINN